MAELRLTDMILVLIEAVRKLDKGELLDEHRVDMGMRPILQDVCAGPTWNMDMLHLLVANGVDVNAHQLRPAERGNYGKGLAPDLTALHVLATGDSWWQAEAINYLVNAGAQINAVDAGGRTPLHYASMKSVASYEITDSSRFFQLQVCKTLLELGANPNPLDADGVSPLNLAEDAKIIELLLQYGADMNLGTTRTMMRAIRSGRPDILKLCLKNGGDCNIPDRLNSQSDDISQYLIVVTLKCEDRDKKKEQKDLLRLLLNHGVKVDTVVNGETIIHHLFEQVSPSALSPFVEGRFFDPNLRDSTGRTVFLVACDSKATVLPEEASMCQLMAESPYYQDIDYLAVDKIGWHMGFHILRNWNEEFGARLSKQLQSLVLQKDNRGHSCLFHALKHHELKPAQQMIDLGGDFWEEDPDGDYALHHICRFEDSFPYLGRYIPIMTKFLSKKSINVRNRLGETPLHIYLSTSAESEGRALDGLQFLISNGADVFAKDNRGETMLHRIASRRSRLQRLYSTALVGITYLDGYHEAYEYNFELFRQFIGYGCDLLEEDNEGVTALDVAVATQNEKIVEAYQRKPTATT